MADTPCIQCGQPSGEPPRLNHLPNGLPCPSCRDRLLEALPPPFPGTPEPEEEFEIEFHAEWDEDEEEADDRFSPRGFQPRYLAGDGGDEPA